VVDVDVGQRIRPQRRFLRVGVGDPHLDDERLGHRLHLEVAHEEPWRVPAVLERRLVGELQALDHALGQRA
jgi:hypothetical protein